MGYQVVESKEFEKKIDELEKEYGRVFTIKAYLSFLLWKKPYYIGEKVQDNFYVYRSDEQFCNGVPQIDVLYQIDDENETVTIIDFQVIEKEDE